MLNIPECSKCVVESRCFTSFHFRHRRLDCRAHVQEDSQASVWTSCEAPCGNDGRAPQAATWARRPKPVTWRSVLKSRSTRWQLRGVTEAAGGGILRSQLISHRGRQQKRPHRLQVKVQSTSSSQSLMTAGPRDGGLNNGDMKYGGESVHPYRANVSSSVCSGRVCLHRGCMVYTSSSLWWGQSCSQEGSHMSPNTPPPATNQTMYSFSLSI